MSQLNMVIFLASLGKGFIDMLESDLRENNQDTSQHCTVDDVGNRN